MASTDIDMNRTAESAQLSLDPLMRPQSVAVVGASPRPLHGSVALANLKRAGTAELFVVNPKYDEVLGVPSYPSVDALPTVPDCVIIAVGKDSVVSILTAAGERGVRGAVVLTAGFGELGGEGRAVEARLAEVAGRYGMAVCGPNCMGIANLVDGLPLYAAMLDTEDADGGPRNVAMVAQSGSVSLALTVTSRLNCAYVVSTGNQAVLDATDYIAYCLDDGRVDAVGVFLEAVRKPAHFESVARDAREAGKPLVVCKAGRSTAGQEATRAHTGALAGAYEVFEGICRQYGVILVEDLDALVETLVLVSGVSSFPDTLELGVVNCSGGENALLADLADPCDLAFASLTERTRCTLERVLPEFGHVTNPLDVTGALVFDRAGYEAALEALVGDERVGFGLVTQDIPRSAREETRRLFEPMVEATAAVAARSGTPMAFLTTISGETDPRLAGILRRGHVPVLEGLEKGLRAVERMLWWTRRRRELAVEETDEMPVVPAERAEALASAELTVADASSEGRVVGEVDAKRLLGDLGFPVVPERLVADEEAAVAAADELGYSVAMKVASDEILHKSDVGGVRLGLDSEAVVRAAFRSLSEIAYQVVVQPMVRNGVEVLLGMKRDPLWGPVVVVGLGGTMVEEMKATSFRGVPVTRKEVSGMLAEIPGATVLRRGRRGQGPRDIDGLVHLVVDFSAVSAGLSEVVQEIDLNPVVLHEAGAGVTVVDALIVPR